MINNLPEPHFLKNKQQKLMFQNIDLFLFQKHIFDTFFT